MGHTRIGIENVTYLARNMSIHLHSHDSMTVFVRYVSNTPRMSEATKPINVHYEAKGKFSEHKLLSQNLVPQCASTVDCCRAALSFFEFDLSVFLAAAARRLSRLANKSSVIIAPLQTCGAHHVDLPQGPKVILSSPGVSSFW